MSSSSAAATVSRSPSPSTPEASDTLDPVAIHSDADLNSSWYLNMHQTKSLQPWDMDSAIYVPLHKTEEDQMLRLDELLEQHAYEDSPSPELSSSHEYSSPPSQPPHSSPIQPHVEPFVSGLIQSPHQPNGSVSMTKPIPPPASLPRKPDLSITNHKVVCPAKESCYNLPIMFPSIPEGGTKSRVETQVRVTVDLADANSSSDPFKYNRVGSWKWLKLPLGTATKKRTRKQGKIDPEPQDILYLTTMVTCASAPHSRVLSCSSCQTREAKRVAKKLAARVRPARSDSESGEVDSTHRPAKSKQYEDTTSIIQFNCAECLDFSTGSVVLPLRITCYCRHHREKVGFNVHFTLKDHSGRLVGSGISKPIMITDDHKTTSSSRNPELITNFSSMETEWSQLGAVPNDTLTTESRILSRRKKDLSGNASKKRPKPYDLAGKPQRISREGSISSIASPSTLYSPLPTTRSPTPSSVLQQLMLTELNNSSPTQSLQNSRQVLELSLDTFTTSQDHQITDVQISDASLEVELPHSPSPLCLPSIAPSMMMAPSQPMPFMFFDASGVQQSRPVQLPTIHRLIPNLGPTHGGIEVTILGANFHPSLQLNCVFGDVTASSTQRWSDNTLVCLLPPRATPGVVAVWFDGLQKTENAPLSLFTYQDETDRALMELALQVVGLKMTGKIEDAKNVAMRIVGNAGNEDSHNQGGSSSSNMQMASSALRDIRPLLMIQKKENENFESLIVDFLAILDTPVDNNLAPNAIRTVDAISQTCSSGQTLLHLAAFLGFASLTGFLVARQADLDARDRNGYTALHFAALSRSSQCARILVEAGADREIVNVAGLTAEEISEDGFFSDIVHATSAFDSDDYRSTDEDEEAVWGDVEEDADNHMLHILMKRSSHRALRRGHSSGKATPRLSADVSRSTTPPPALCRSEKDESNEKRPHPSVDAKQTASFVEMIQRTFAQLPVAQGIIPNIPQLPFPHLPQLPDLPAVPWGSLPQIPMVFPVFVPMMPGWPSFLGGEQQSESGDRVDDSNRRMGTGAIRAANEWRATWEKWVALAVATARQQTDELPPPMYTPRAEQDESPQVPIYDSQADNATTINAAGRAHSAPDMRPVGYGTPVPEQEVGAYAYQPNIKQRKLKTKQDRMLLLFWLPILLLSVVWAIHNGVRFAFHTLKMALPLRPPMRA